MSRAALLVALTLAAALAVTAAVLMRPPANAKSASPLAFDPARVTSLSVTSPDGSCTFARDGAAWIFTMRRADGAGFAHYADSAKIQAALAMLAAVRGADEASAPDPRGATTLELTLADGTIRVVVGSNPLSGRVPVSITRAVAGDRGTATAFLGPLEPFEPLIRATGSSSAASSFLDSSVFRWTGAPTSITISKDGTIIRAERVGIMWHLRSPLETPADYRAMGQIQAALANLSLQEASPAPAGPMPATAFSVAFTVEDATSPEHSLSVLSDGSGAALLTSPLGTTLIVLRDIDVDRLTPRVTTVINHIASAFPTADLTTIRVSPPSEDAGPGRTYTRRADTWTEGEAPLQETPLAAVSALAQLLGNRRADAVYLDPPTGFAPVANLLVDVRVSKQPLSFVIGTADSPTASAGGPARRVLALRAGPITRLYPLNEFESILAFLSATVGEAEPDSGVR
jgi:hypothetical protein